MEMTNTLNRLFGYARTKTLVTVGIALGIAISIGSGASGASIGVNFQRNGSGVNNTDPNSLLPADAAGAPGYVQTNWNNLGRFGDSVNLVDSSGAPSGVTNAWDATGTWSQTGTTAATQLSPDGNLMNGYLDSNGQNANGNNTTTNTYAVLGTSLYGNAGQNKPLVYFSGITTW